MTDSKSRSSRRAFFLHGGAMLGAGVATTGGATALLAPSASGASQTLGSAQDREAIRQLHLTFTGSLEEQAYELAAQLFHEEAQLDLGGATASGQPAIARLFALGYRLQQAAALHTAYRQNASQRQDVVTLSADRRQAAATFHTEAQISVPLRADCTAAQMARLQGQMADRRWESGRFDGRYVKVQGQWKMASLRYTRS